MHSFVWTKLLEVELLGQGHAHRRLWWTLQIALQKVVCMCTSVAPPHSHAHWVLPLPRFLIKVNVLFVCWLAVSIDVFLICLFASKNLEFFYYSLRSKWELTINRFSYFSKDISCMCKKTAGPSGCILARNTHFHCFDFWPVILCITDLPWVKYNDLRGTTV